MPVRLLLRQRKQHKMARKLGISTDALLRIPAQKSTPPPLNLAKIDYEMAKRQFTMVGNKSRRSSPEAQISEPEEIQVETPSNLPTFTRPVHTKCPTINVFFQLPVTRNVTDEQLYEEFKSDYIARGIENELRRRRRCSKRVRRIGKSKISK